MKRLLPFFLFLFIIQKCLAQTIPPTLIYAAKDEKSKLDIYDASGKKIFTGVDWAYSNAWTWIFVVDPSTKLSKVYDWKGKLLIDNVEESQSAYTILNRVAIRKNGKWGFYDRNGKLRIAHQFEHVSHFDKDMALVQSGDTLTYPIDTNGKRILKAFDPNEYSFQDSDISIGMSGDFYSSSFSKFSDKNKQGLKDKSGNVLIPAIYDELHDPKEQFQLITVGLNKKFGVVKFGGALVIPVRYTTVYVLNDYF